MSERIHNHNTDENHDERDRHEELCAFVLGELDGPAAAKVEAALADSAELREERDAIEATIGLVRSACSGGESLSPKILTTIEKAASPTPAPPAWYLATPVRLAAGFLALAGGVIWGKALLTAPPDGGELAVARLEDQIRYETERTRGVGLLDGEEALARGFRRSEVESLESASEESGEVAERHKRLKLGRELGENRESGSRSASSFQTELGAAPGQPVGGRDSQALSKAPGETLGYDARQSGQAGGQVKVILPGDTLRDELHTLGSADTAGLEGVGVDKNALVVDQKTWPGAGGGAGQDATRGGSGGGAYKRAGEVAPPNTETGVALDEATLKSLAALGYTGGGGGGSGGGVHLADGEDGDFRGRAENFYARTIEQERGGEKDVALGLPAERSRRERKTEIEDLAELQLLVGKKGDASGSPGPAGPATPGSAAAPPARGSAAPTGNARGEAEASKVVAGVKLYGEGFDGDTDYFLGDWGMTDEGRARVPVRNELTPAQLDELCRHRVDRILYHCRRQPDEKPSAMFFRFWGDNAFELAQLDNLSTFGVDVDTASYALARRYLTEGHLPEKAQVRTEEFVNYFKPDIAAPLEGTFAIHTDIAPSRFGGVEGTTSQRWMMRVVVRGREVGLGERKPLLLTFVVDTSGSMKENNRLELVKHALRLLTSQLDVNDSIAIVAFSNEARMVLPMTSMASRGVVEAAIYGLQPNGSTNAEGGLRLGYEIATAALSAGATNRVVLLSDGVANVGQTDQDRINADVKRNRDLGIYLNTIGVGMNNHNDVFLEQLANKGDGLCNYVDSAIEARRALVDNFTGAFEPIARDVKIQVEFDKAQVYRYRLLGYENRSIADVDFRNDAIDAGEIGSGHQVVALYELEMTGTQSTEPLASVRLRWKQPIGVGRDPLEDTATEISHAAYFDGASSWEGASDGFKRSALVAQFAEILRRSVHAKSDSLDELIAETAALAPRMGDPDVSEFLALLQKGRELIVRQAPRYDDLTLCIDAIRRNRVLHAQYDELRRTEGRAVIDELERQNAQLEARIRELIRSEVEHQIR